MVVASEDAQFGFPEVGVGLSVTGGISRLLPMLVGWAKAKELLLLGERVTGAEAAADRAGRPRRARGRARGRRAGARPAPRRAARRSPSAWPSRSLDHGLDATLEEAMVREVDHAILTSLSGEGAAPKEAFTRG